MAGEMSGDASLIQYSDEYNLLHLIAADIFRHQQTGAIHHFNVFFTITRVVRSVAMFQCVRKVRLAHSVAKSSDFPDWLKRY